MSEPPERREISGCLEIGRFIAASAVVISHLASMLGTMALVPGQRLLGGVQMPAVLAVQFFFVLSGFVMVRAHLGDFGQIRAVPKFWWRRVCRIYPMYWLALIIPCYYRFQYQPLRVIIKTTARIVVLQPWTQPEFVLSAWSLRYEVAFYILFGLCLVPYFGRLLLIVWVAAVLWLCDPAWMAFAGLPVPHALSSLAAGYGGHFLSFMDIYFLCGLLSGWVFSTFRLGRLACTGLLVAGGLGLGAELPALAWGLDYGPPPSAIPVGLSVAAIMTGAAGLERSGLFVCGRIARRLGRISYPLYILHLSLLLVFSQEYRTLRLGLPGLYGAFGLGLIVIYAISIAADAWIDHPVQSWLRGLTMAPLHPNNLRLTGLHLKKMLAFGR